jgi:excisionase family DNA binding protein
MSELITLEQLAQYLQMSEAKIYKLAQAGKIPGYKVGHHWRFYKEEIEEWIKSQRPLKGIQTSAEKKLSIKKNIKTTAKLKNRQEISIKS